MILSEEAFNAYDAALQRQTQEAADKLAAFMETIDFSGDYEAKKAARNKVIAFMQELVATYGDTAATLAADLYNEMAEEAGVSVSDAVLADRVSDHAVASSARYHAKNLWGQEPNIDAFKAGVLVALQRYIRHQANQTIIKNAGRDEKTRGVRFARVPKGSETCAFCLMLASRGFVYFSEMSAEGLNHGHDNCDCDVIPGFGENPGIGGYSHKRYQKLYDDNVTYDQYGHVRVEDTLNNMRRAIYDDYKDRRNALRRQRYTEQKKAKG